MSSTSMASIKVISECFVKPIYEVEAAKQPYHLSPLEVSMISIDPVQKGLLFTLNNPPSSDVYDRTKVVSHLLDKLKHSISIALVHFYPLAGRFVTQQYPDEHACSVFVDCNKGPGARLIHATTTQEVTVSDIVSSVDVHTIVRSFFELGEKTVNYDGHTKALLSIQVTELLDGVFIGFTMNHSVVDGTSFIHFVSMLSEIYRSNDHISDSITPIKISRPPIFNYKPWINDCGNDSNEDAEIVKLPYLELDELIEHGFDPGQLRERIFHFSPTSLAALKAKANQECGTTHNVISSFQALTALVWRSITRARNLPSDQLTSCSILINARSRFNPPLSDDYIGNFISATQCICSVDELLAHGLGWAAMNLDKSIVAQDGKTILGLYKIISDNPVIVRRSAVADYHGPNRVIIGGSARFDIYGPEFGLGRAVAAQMGFPNKEDGKVTANPGCEGGGSVDLEICLRPDFMANLECDSEFMCNVSLY